MENGNPSPSVEKRYVIVSTGVIGYGFALAWGCLIAQLVLLTLAAQLGAGDWAPLVLFVYAHCFFVVAMTDFGMRTADSGDAMLSESVGRGLAAGALLFVLLGVAASATWFVDFGRYWPGEAAAPYAIGTLWLGVAASALPARISAFVGGDRLVLRPLWQRILIAAPPVPLLWPLWWFLGAAGRCTGECWGLFEGGMVALPLLALSLFGTCVSAAAVAALGVRERIEA